MGGAYVQCIIMLVRRTEALTECGQYHTNYTCIICVRVSIVARIVQQWDGMA